MLITLALASSILLPFIGALLLLIFPRLSEQAASRLAIVATVLSSASVVLALGIWLTQGAPSFRTPEWTLLSHGEYRFNLGLIIDPAAAVFLFLVEFTSGMVIRFSRVYLHREPGFRRFFAIVLLFRGAMCLLTLAGNLDLLFVGWEFVGLASFLLIAFYHERRQAVRNALKTFSIYRIADVGMLLGAYLEHTSGHTGIGFLLLLAAAGKSAQLPFSFWIARAMEGPTPSSALFYGALSVHAGAYLLLRTYPIWGDVTAVHICVGLLGLLTAIFCTLFSRTQHTIKGQVGYASVTQVGLIFVELALGLRWLALLHITANALLRCYQLLVSPSAVAYLLRQQSSVGAVQVSDERSLSRRLLPARFRSTLYVFALSEGYLEALLLAVFWEPLRKIGSTFGRFGKVIVISGSGLALVAAYKLHGPEPVQAIWAGGTFALLAIVLSGIALKSRETPASSLAWITGSYLSSVLAVWLSLGGENAQTELAYGSGIALSCALALAGVIPALRNKYQGEPGNHHWPFWFASSAAFLGVLGIMGFPLLPTFFGEDMILHDAFKVHRLFALLLTGVFALNGYIGMRTFAFVFYRESRTSVR